MMDFNHYQVLGIARTASQAQVKAAFKALAVKYHPDKNPGVAFYEEHFKKINAAYQVLGNEQKRTAYDRKLDQRPIKKARPHPDPYFKQKEDRKPPSQEKRHQKKSKAKNSNKWGVLLSAMVAFMLFIQGAVWFYGFMNRFAAKTRLEEGLKQREEGHLLDAMVSFSEAIRFDKEFSEAYFQRGVTYIMLYQNYDKPRYDFRTAIRTSEKPSYRHYYQLGYCQLKEGNFEDAITALEFSIRLNPQFDSGLVTLGEIHAYQLENFESGRKYFFNALLANPSLEHAKTGMGYCQLNLGKYREAISTFSEVIENSPTPMKSYYYRGLAFARINELDSACEDMRAAMNRGLEQAKEKVSLFCDAKNNRQN